MNEDILTNLVFSLIYRILKSGWICSIEYNIIVKFKSYILYKNLTIYYNVINIIMSSL